MDSTTGLPAVRLRNQNFQNSNASRPVVDLVLQLQALKAGGLDFDFELAPSITYELAKGSLYKVAPTLPPKRYGMMKLRKMVRLC